MGSLAEKSLTNLTPFAIRFNSHVFINRWICMAAMDGMVLAQYSGKPKAYSTGDHLFPRNRVYSACTVVVNC